MYICLTSNPFFYPPWGALSRTRPPRPPCQRGSGKSSLPSREVRLLLPLRPRHLLLLSCNTEGLPNQTAAYQIQPHYPPSFAHHSTPRTHNRTAVIYCFGRIGRTGTLVGCWLSKAVTSRSLGGDARRCQGRTKGSRCTGDQVERRREELESEADPGKYKTDDLHAHFQAYSTRVIANSIVGTNGCALYTTSPACRREYRLKTSNRDDSNSCPITPRPMQRYSTAVTHDFGVMTTEEVSKWVARTLSSPLM